MSHRRDLAHLRLQIASEEEKRQKSKEQHLAGIASGKWCRAHHVGCKETRPHSHNQDGDVVLTKPKPVLEEA